jgi:hypothetical protein
MYTGRGTYNMGNIDLRMFGSIVTHCMDCCWMRAELCTLTSDTGYPNYMWNYKEEKRMLEQFMKTM